MSRPKLKPEEKKILCNYYLPPKTDKRLKEIAHRRSVAKGRKVSEATLVEAAIRHLPMPPKPTPERVAEYEAQKLSKAKGGK